jgi:hypothetical protein
VVPEPPAIGARSHGPLVVIVIESSKRRGCAPLEKIAIHYRKQGTFLKFFNSLIPRNITQIYSSVPKPTKVKETDEYMPGMFVG